MDRATFHNVVYCSHATKLVTATELEELVITSQTNNRRRGITGLLVHGGGMFLQWLEGPRDEVEQLMCTISSDPRHEAIVRLQMLYGLEERIYPGLAMQKASPADLRRIMVDCLNRTHNSSNRGLILLMIEMLQSEKLRPLMANRLSLTDDDMTLPFRPRAASAEGRA